MRYCSQAALFVLLAFLLAAGPAVAQGTYDATVRVSDHVVNTVRSEMFGDNLEWVDSCRLWRQDLHGFDPQMVQAIKDAGVRQIRYPGGTLSDYFHWQDAIGTNRKPIPNPFNNGTPQYPYFGPDELKQLTDQLDIPAYITLNAGTGTPDEAAGWVKYCRDHGQRVSAFEVGNEIYMSNTPVPGLPVDKTAQQYIDFFLATRSKIDAIAPGTKVGAVGLLNTGLIPICRDPKWLQEVVTGIGGKMDFIAIHDGYAPGLRAIGIGNPARLSDDDFEKAFLGAPLFVRDNIEATKAVIAEAAPGAHIDIHITECGPFVVPNGGDTTAQLADLQWNRSLTGALFLAGFYSMVLDEPKVTDVDHLPLLQDYFGALEGVHDAGEHRQIWRNAAFYVFQEYSGFAGRTVLRTDVAGPTYAAQATGLIPANDAVPCLDADSFRTPDGKTVSIAMLNRDTTRTCHVTIRPGPDSFHVERITLLTGPALDSANEPDEPEAVHPARQLINKDISGGELELDIPPHALMTVDIGMP